MAGLLEREHARQAQLRAQGLDPGVPSWAQDRPSPEGLSEEATRGPEYATNLWESFQSGMQVSVAGLALRQQGPDLYLQENATRAQRIAQTVGTIIGDLPTYTAGALAGAATAPGTTIAAPMIAGGTSMGLTEGSRKWLLDQFDAGASKQDISDRLAATAWATAKGGIIGSATFGVGAKARQLLAKPAAPGAVEGALAGSTQAGATTPVLGLGGEVKVAASELATMVATSSALEGHIPSPDDFMDIALILAGVKGATVTAGKLREIYLRTGKTPDEVRREALENPNTYQELIDAQYPAVPQNLRGFIRSEFGPLAPETLAQKPIPLAVNQSLGGPSRKRPEQILFGDDGRAQGKWDFNITTWEGPDSVRQLAKQLAWQNKNEMQAASGGRKTMDMMAEEKASWLREALGKDVLDPVKQLMDADPVTWAAEVGARYDLARGALGEMQGRAARIREREAAGQKPTDVELAEFFAAEESATMALRVLRNQEAEAGRALAMIRHRKKASTTEEMDAMVKDVLESYGGKERAEMYTKMVSEIRDPKQLAELAKKYTFTEKLGYAVNSFLVSGFRTHEVNILSTMGFTGMRIPESQMTALIGKLRNNAERSTFTESLGLMQGVGIGYMKALRATHQALKLDEGQYKTLQGMWREFQGIRRSDKTEELEGRPLKGTFGDGKLDTIIGDILATPYKALSAGDHFTGLGNYWGSLYQQAWRQVVKGEAGLPNLKFTKRFSEEQLVTVDLRALREKLDAMGRSPEGDKLVALSKKLDSIKEINAPEVSLRKDGSVGVTDGRTRLQVFADQGYTHVKVAVPKEQAAQFRAQFGAARNPRIMSREFHQKVRDLAENPTKKMEEVAFADRLKYNFLEEGGPIVKGLQQLRKDIPLLRVTPLNFIQTPGAIFREFTRRTPFAPAVRQWRDDYKAGGLKRDKALAELSTGTGIGILAYWMASEGIITGSGHPDKEQRDADYANNWQPNSLWVPGTGYVSMGRYEPMATLFTAAANLQQASDLMTQEEQEKAWTALMFAGVEVAHNKTWMQGLSSLVNAIANPDRYGEGWLENLATMAVPQLLGQAAQTMDPYVREIDGVWSAVLSRIPGARESLAKQYDPFGEPIAAASGLWPGSPSTVRMPTGDKVRAEAQRLGISMSDAPRKLSAGTMFGESAMVELEPEQRSQYIQQAGKMAYRIMSNRVNSPGWEHIPGALQRMQFEEAFRDGRDLAREQLLTPGQRREALDTLREGLDLR